ncbi:MULTISPECIES: hypothetical protein [unclassified Acidocella]|nr:MULTISPECIES: hypothetical protein [unclassified Acidocella]WBO60576.1 hypothetical protein GT370_07335 [Acidocella sp. MX-AZ03]
MFRDLPAVLLVALLVCIATLWGMGVPPSAVAATLSAGIAGLVGGS